MTNKIREQGNKSTWANQGIIWCNKRLFYAFITRQQKIVFQLGGKSKVVLNFCKGFWCSPLYDKPQVFITPYSNVFERFDAFRGVLLGAYQCDCFSTVSHNHVFVFLVIQGQFIELIPLEYSVKLTICTHEQVSENQSNIVVFNKKKKYTSESSAPLYDSFISWRSWCTFSETMLKVRSDEF